MVVNTIIIVFTIILIFSIIVIGKAVTKQKRFNKVYDFKENVDYKVISATVSDSAEAINKAEIELLSGPFEGVKYYYGNIGEIQESDNEEYATLSFEYDIIDSNNIDGLIENVDFKNHIGEVLVSIVITSAERHKEFNEMLENMKIVDDEGNVVSRPE